MPGAFLFFVLLIISPARGIYGQAGSAGMVLVEGGTFMMGNSAKDRYDDGNERSYEASVKTFYMARYEVTQREWAELMGTTPAEQLGKEESMKNLFGLRGVGDDYPMYYISWEEAAEYCNRLSRREGLGPAYSGSGEDITCDFEASGYRLPTEEEWEYAAKGGNKAPAVYRYSGGNDVNLVGWHDGNSGGGAHPVGTREPNDLGIYDMSGNVWEWCWDTYYGRVRIVRGGCWNVYARYLRSANRHAENMMYRDSQIGFRVVRRY
jgi:formylglycine-generating enzyme required for sulfatase activity